MVRQDATMTSSGCRRISSPERALPGRSLGAFASGRVGQTDVSRACAGLKVIVELVEATEPVNSESLADAFARDLQTDTVQRWADEVGAAVAASRAACDLTKPDRHTGTEHRRREIERKIAALQRQLEGLNDGPDTVERY